MANHYEYRAGELVEKSPGEERTIDPERALNKYRGLILSVKDHKERLDEAKEELEELEPEIGKMLDEAKREAEESEGVPEQVREDMDEKANEARLALKRVRERKQPEESN